MTASLMVLTSLLAAGPAPKGGCYVVTNTRILPCTASRAEIEAASKPRSTAPAPRPSTGGTGAGPASGGTGAGPSGVGTPAIPPPPGARGTRGEVSPPGPERELAEAQEIPEMEERLQNAEAERLASEEARQRAEEQRQAALEELAGIRDELAVTRQREEQAAQAREQVRSQLDDSAADLLRADATLATGNVADTEDSLSRAADAFTDAHGRQGSAWIQAARDALARSDLWAARIAITHAYRAAARTQPEP